MDGHREYTVYALLDPGTNQPRYVGRTLMPLQARLKQHLRAALRGEPWDVCQWIRSLAEPPTIRALQTLLCDRDTADRAEQDAIARYRSQGFALTNMTDGGVGMRGHVASPLTCRRRSRALVGKPKSPESVERMAKSLTGRRLSEEHRAKISAAQMGKKMPPRTPEHAAKLAAANRGKHVSLETRAKQSAAHRGRRQSQESIEKTRKALIGRTRSPEHCAKLSAAIRGRTLSVEWRAKISAGLRAAHQKRRLAAGGDCG